MATEKTCPDCAESVLADARVCKHCGYRFDGAIAAPPPVDQPPAGPPSLRGYPAASAQMDHPKGTTILVLGILGLVLCQLLAPIAYLWANKVLEQIDANPGRYRNRGSVQAGKVMGIIGSVFLILIVAWFVFVVGVVSTSGVSNDSKANACRTEKRTLNTAIEAFNAKYGEAPSSLDQLYQAGLIRDTETLGYTVAYGEVRGTCS